MTFITIIDKGTTPSPGHRADPSCGETILDLRSSGRTSTGCREQAPGQRVVLRNAAMQARDAADPLIAGELCNSPVIASLIQPRLRGDELE